MREMTVDMKMSAAEILNEVRRQQWEMNSTRYKPDATLFISEDCWDTLLKELPLASGFNIKVNSGPTRGLMGYTTIIVKGLKQYVELKENAGYGGRVGVSLGFDEWGMVNANIFKTD